jgi:hypothetical protein
MPLAERLRGKTSLQLGAFSIVSALGIALVYWVFSDEQAPALVKTLWLFYAPAWVVSNAFFGGIHGAPAWSFLPSVVLAVVVQNLVLWLLVRWLLHRFPRRRPS